MDAEQIAISVSVSFDITKRDTVELRAKEMIKFDYWHRI